MKTQLMVDVSKKGYQQDRSPNRVGKEGACVQGGSARGEKRKRRTSTGGTPGRGPKGAPGVRWRKIMTRVGRLEGARLRFSRWGKVNNGGPRECGEAKRL